MTATTTASARLEAQPFELLAAVAVYLPPASNDLMARISRRCRYVWTKMLATPSFIRVNLAATSLAGAMMARTSHLEILLKTSPLEFSNISVWYLREIIHLLPDLNPETGERYRLFSDFLIWYVMDQRCDVATRQMDKRCLKQVIKVTNTNFDNLRSLATAVASALSLTDTRERVIRTAELTVRTLLHPPNKQCHAMVAPIVRAISMQEHPTLCNMCFLHLCHVGQSELIEYMIESNKGNPSFHDSVIFRVAVSNGKLEIARRLLQVTDHRMVHRHAVDEALFDASYLNDCDAIRFLIDEAGCDLALTGRAAFLIALGRGNVNAARIVLATGRVDPALNNNEPLIMAARSGSLDCVGLLLDSGSTAVDPAAQSGLPLIEAARCGHTSIVKTLLATGAVSISVQDWLPVMVAVECDRIDVIRFFISQSLLTDRAVVLRFKEATMRLKNSIKHGESIIQALDGIRLSQYPPSS